MPPTREEPLNQAALSTSNPSQLMQFHSAALTWIWDPGASLPGEQPNQQTCDSPWLFVCVSSELLPAKWNGSRDTPDHTALGYPPAPRLGHSAAGWETSARFQLSSWFSYLLIKYPTHLPGECCGSMLLLIPPLRSVPVSKKIRVLVNVKK